MFLATVWLARNTSPVGADAPRIVEIKPGTDTGRMATLLKRDGLIRSESAFRYGVHKWGLAGRLKAGYYELSPAMSAEEIARTIAEGRTATIKVTIPEGFTLQQIAAAVEEPGLCSEEEFLKAAVPDTVAELEAPIEVDSVEGYLFPDTYIFEVGTEPAAIVTAMVDTFRQRVIEGMEDDLAATDLSPAEIVTIASMIEREARVEKDRPLIASVIYNRLERGMKLQIDATVIYALGEHRDRLTHDDLKVKSPFNTYRHKGLPPHPIANPGEASIRAALHPAETDYLYYVARPDGSHAFTRTYKEHQQAIRAIRGG